MPFIQTTPLPDNALLRIYERSGYTDCYTVDVRGAVTLAQFVAAFYTTWVFKLERLVLRWAVARPSTDFQANQLASGLHDSFAAWHVEARSTNQLLMCDYQWRTRSWFMVSGVNTSEGPVTRLFFGSAVVPGGNAGSRKRDMGRVFRALLGFHRLYSRVLLAATRASLRRG